MPSTSSCVTSLHVGGAHELAVLHHADPVGEVEHVVDVVADEEDADALLLQLQTRSPTCCVSCGPSAAVGSSMMRMRALK